MLNVQVFKIASCQVPDLACESDGLIVTFGLGVNISVENPNRQFF